MTISTLFFIFLAAMVFGIIAAFANFIVGAKNMFNGNGSFGTTVMFHFIFGLFYVLGGLGATITGIIWLVQYIKS